LAEVFISYARANEAVAKRAGNALKVSGFEVWWDDQLPAHRPYGNIIEQKLRGAAAVVVLWSKEAAQSEWVRAEADFARGERKLVQAQLDEALPPLPFNQIQCADLRGWRGNRKHRGWTKLAESVRSVVAGEPLQSPEPKPIAARRLPKRWLAAVAVALLLVTAGAILFLSQRSGVIEDRPRIAVLPFKSVGASNSSLVEGIWEDTRQALSRNPQLLVLGPNTSEEISEKGTGAVRRAADYLVEASVRTATDRVRVSTSLVRSRDGAEMWSQTFDGKLDDVFKLQSQIAQEIEGRIRGRLARGGGKLPENITTTGEVYALYSDARSKIRNRQVTRYPEAIKQLEKVVTMDPNFAPGWATLSVAVRMAAPGKISRHIGREEAYARRAIALAPNLAAGHAALGLALGQHGPQAEAALRRAVALDPSDVEALNWLGNSIDDRTRPTEKFKIYSRIVEIEPLWPSAVGNRVIMLLEAGNLAAAGQEKKRLERLGSTELAATVAMQIANAKGDWAEAARIGIRTYNAAAPDERRVLVHDLVFALLKLGDFDAVQANFPEVLPPMASLLWRNDPRALDMIEAMNLSPRDFFDMGPPTFSASRVYVLSRRGKRLAQLYRSAISSPEELDTPLLAPVIALALKQAGDLAEANRVLNVAEQSLTRQKSDAPSSQWSRQALLARVYAVQGRKAEALRHLTAAVDAGWIAEPPPILSDIALDPPLALLKGHPRFEAARQKVLDHVRRLREQVGPIHLNGSRPAAQAA
jgi:TolB-like protein/Flp pilus assembly protein TadD